VGYIKIDRRILNHPALQKRGQPYCEKTAFLWLLLEAGFVDRLYRIKDKTVKLKRGQLCSSVRFMAEAWGWEKSRVQRFLARLKEFDTISSDTPDDTPADTPNVLTICHYDDYQDTPSDTPNDTKHNKGYNKGNNNIVSKEIEIAFEEWWKSFEFSGNNKGSKKKALSFYKKKYNDKKLLKRIVETYNHYSSSQKQKNLSAPMVTTWLSGENWDSYQTPEERSFDNKIVNFDPLFDVKKYVSFVKKGIRIPNISDDQVSKMLSEGLISQEEYDRW